MFTTIEAILQCPITKESLTYVQHIKEENTTILNLSEVELSHGFLNTSKTIFYPIIDNIICMMPEYCFSNASYTSDKDILSVKDFYNGFGWNKNDEGKYYDAKMFIDQRDVAQEYKTLTNKRVSSLFAEKGKFLLDIASGPVYQQDYQEFGKNFEYRVCIDISIQALKEAQKNLHAYKAFFIVGDATNIPLKTECIDQVVSMHTVYHIPKQKQIEAVHEMARVCKAGSKAVIVYNWGWHSMLMNLSLFPFQVVRFVKRVQKIYFPQSVNKKSEAGLYFYSHSPAYFRNRVPENCTMRISVLKTIHENFIKHYIRKNKASENFLAWLYRTENKFPEFFGKNGAFCLIILDKKPKN